METNTNKIRKKKSQFVVIIPKFCIFQIVLQVFLEFALFYNFIFIYRQKFENEN